MSEGLGEILALVGVGDLCEQMDRYLMVKEFAHEADVDATVVIVGLLGDVLVDVIWEGGDALYVYGCLSVWGIGGDELPVL